MRDSINDYLIRGRGRFIWSDLFGCECQTSWDCNATIRDWARVIVPFYAQQTGLVVVPPNMLYIEYVNDTPPVAVPTFTRTDADAGIDYYAGLEESEDGDFLRVPVAMTDVLNDPSEGDVGINTVRFLAMATGSAGIHAKPFSTGVSTIIGAALVAAPDSLDWTKDIVHSRLYLSPENQLLKPASPNLQGQYELTLR